MSTESKTRTITMSHRPPVKITDDAWPVIAVATYDHEDQFNGLGFIRVRQHRDGRRLIYGKVESPMSRDGKGTSTWLRAGYLVDKGGDTVAVIKQVSAEIEETENLAQYCTANLPAEQL